MPESYAARWKPAVFKITEGGFAGAKKSSAGAEYSLGERAQCADPASVKIPAFKQTVLRRAWAAQGQARAPNIMRRAMKLRSGGHTSSVNKPNLRAQEMGGTFVVNTRIRPSVKPIVPPRSSRRARAHAASRAGLPGSVASRTARDRVWTSRKARLKPCPATGWRVWAALPSQAVRGSTMVLR